MNNNNAARRFEIHCADGRCVAVFESKTSRKADNLCAKLNNIANKTHAYVVRDMTGRAF